MTWEYEIVMDEDEAEQDERDVDPAAESPTPPAVADDDFEAHAWRAQS